MNDTTTPTPSRRRRPRFRPVEVVDVRRLSPRLVSIVFTGAFDDFAVDAPTRHIKVLVPGDGEHAVALPEVGADGVIWPDGTPRPAVRTYTPRRFDPMTGILEVQFVVHGEGPASTWADRARPGDRLAVAGPGGRAPLELTSGPWVIAGDESAIPAIGTLLDALPFDATAEVYVEIEDCAGQIDLDGRASAKITWLVRSVGDEPGAALHDALRAATITDATRVWVACEAVAVRRIRRLVLERGEVGPSGLVTRGYWRAGEANHPDHDHGED